VRHAPTNAARTPKATKPARLRRHENTSLLNLLIERDFQFFGEFVGVERAQREVAAFNSDHRHFALAIIDLQHDGFGGGVIVNVDLAIRNASVAQKTLGPAAIAAPGSLIHGNV
jgi:hypothetical protein